MHAAGNKSPSLAHTILPTRSPVTMATNQAKPSSPHRQYPLKTSSSGNGNLLAMKNNPPSPLMMTSLRHPGSSSVAEAEFALRQAAEMQRAHVARQAAEKEKAELMQRQLAAVMATSNRQFNPQQPSQLERRPSSTSSLGVSRVPQTSYTTNQGVVDESKLQAKMFNRFKLLLIKRKSTILKA